jgi:hypothetical protein
MATSIKAQIAPIAFGNISFEGLLGGDGRFYIAVPQICELFQIAPNQASRKVKALMGKGFQFDKAKTSLHPKDVNVIPFEAFEILLMLLDRNGNREAQAFRDTLVGLSLHQLACDAFGIKFDKDERQAWLLVRQESKDLFWELSGAVQVWMESRTCTAPPFTYYKNAFDALNRRLFGMPSKKIRESLGLSSDSALCRDHFGRASLRHINQVQELAAKLMARDRSLAPIDAVNRAADANLLEPSDFRI